MVIDCEYAIVLGKLTTTSIEKLAYDYVYNPHSLDLDIASY